MRTLIDASAAFNQDAGIGRYARNIIIRLTAQGDQDQWKLVYASDGSRDRTRFRLSPSSTVKAIELPLSRRNADRLWFRLRVPLDARLFAGGADVVYSPDFTAPPMIGVPRMVTVHDLAFLTHPRQTTDALRRFLEDVVPREIARAERVVVVSYATRDELVRLLNVPEKKVVVARNGVDARFFGASQIDAEARERLGVPARYLLMVGTIEPRKNHLNAMRALEHSGIAPAVPLVIAGRLGWGHEGAMAEARRLAARGMVVLPDYVPEADLPGLYAGAEALLYPSWTEGFGLPVVEALAAGVPVITGTAAALREVGGREAVYVEPADVDELAEQMRRVVDTASTDVDRARRQEWTRQFTWESSTSTVFENLKVLSRG